MSDMMTFPDTVEDFMEQYKIADTKQVYTNGAELVPIFRMKQWFEHLQAIEPERKTGIWKNRSLNILYPEWERYECSVCGGYSYIHKYCPNCGAKMEEGEQE